MEIYYLNLTDEEYNVLNSITIATADVMSSDFAEALHDDSIDVVFTTQELYNLSGFDSDLEDRIKRVLRTLTNRGAA